MEMSLYLDLYYPHPPKPILQEMSLAGSCFQPPYTLGYVDLGPGPKWAQVRPGPKWALAQVGPGTKVARAQVDVCCIRSFHYSSLSATMLLAALLVCQLF